MANVLGNVEEYKFGVYDPKSKAVLSTEKAVDITGDCPNVMPEYRALLLYARSESGIIVQIFRPYPGEASKGVHIHFFLDTLDEEMTDTFVTMAEELGLAPNELLSLIKQQAPS